MLKQGLASAILACIAGTASGAPATGSIHLGEPLIREQVVVPDGWNHVGSEDPRATITLQIALKQSNIEGLRKKLMDISDHTSPNYGKWLSKEELEAYTTPSEETVRLVTAWLDSAGIPSSAVSYPAPDWLHADVSIPVAEKLLSAEYSLYQDSIMGHTVARTLNYSLPQRLHQHIDTIQPTTIFYQAPQAPVSNDDVNSKKTADDCLAHFTPQCVRDYYQVNYKGNGKAATGVTAILNASHDDMKVFRDNFLPGVVQDYIDISAAGNYSATRVSAEADCDTQQALAMGAPNPIGFYNVGPPTNDLFSDLAVYLSSATDLPTSISTSAGMSEGGHPANYFTRICDEFMKAGSRGVTAVFSSGDYGVGSKGQQCTQFVQHFPASCPYVTAVGSTSWRADGVETAAEWRTGLASGGGFSSIFTAPEYQRKDVAAYVTNQVPTSYDGKYNKNGRGYPDVAIAGSYLPYVVQGITHYGNATSLTAPLWNGLLSQINDNRISQGKPTLGFLNPRLYGDANVRAALKDLTIGSNPGCGTSGFSASQGWDPATGLGSMNFTALLTALSS